MSLKAALTALVPTASADPGAVQRQAITMYANPRKAEGATCGAFFLFAGDAPPSESVLAEGVKQIGLTDDE
ncbi:hypothetical protein D3C84_1081580 [compost metagenome]